MLGSHQRVNLYGEIPHLQILKGRVYTTLPLFRPLVVKPAVVFPPEKYSFLSSQMTWPVTLYQMLGMAPAKATGTS